MTELERLQPHSRFMETGRRAYRMDVPISGNPYTEEPYKDLWDKGYRFARVQEEGRRQKNKRPPFRQEGEEGYERRHRHPKPNERRNQDPQRNEPPSTNKLIDRFNRRNRTAI